MPGETSLFVSFYKIFRWVVLLMVILVIFMMLGKPSRPSLPMTSPEAKEQAKSYEQKWDQLAYSHALGQSSEAHFTSDEVTAGFAQQVAGPVPATPAPGGQQNPSNPAPDSAVAENTAVRDVDFDFHGNELTAQCVANAYGKDIYITLSGRLGSKDGYVTFDPTGFKIGNLTIPVSAVNDTLQKKLAEPENREKLKLPDFVRSIHIENGEMVVEEKN